MEAEQKLETLVSNLPGIVFQRLVFPDDTIGYAYLSGSVNKLFGGRTAEENMAAAGTRNMVHADDRDRVGRAIIENARAGKPYSLEFRHILPDGEIIWLRTVCAAPVERPDGVIVQDGVTFDITDIKRAEEEATTAQRRLIDFTIAASDTMWETDAEHRVIWMSDPETKENRYYDTGVMIGLRRWEFPGVAPPDSDSWRPLIDAMEGRNSFRDFEFESKLETGAPVYRRISGRPVFNDNGDFTGYRGISSDLTGAILKDREARATQQRLIDAIEASYQGIALFGPDDRLIVANKALFDLNPNFDDVFVPGTSFEEIISKAARSGDFPAALGVEEEWIRARLEYHRAPSGVFTHVMFGDHHVEIRDERLPDGSSIVRQTDVTEQWISRETLRQNEERFRDFAESSSDWMWETDPEHRITWVSDSVQFHSDISSDSAIGKTRWDHIGIDLNTDAHWRELAETMDAQSRIRDFRYSRRDNDGNLRHRNLSGVPYYDEDGVFLGYRGASTDITALVKAEEAEQRFLSAINTADEGLILLDPDDKIVFANQKSRQFLGAKADDMADGITFADMLRNYLDDNQFGIDTEARDKWIARRLEHHRNSDNQAPIVSQRTDEFVLEVREEILPDGSCIIFQNDVTVRTKVENALVESRQRFQDFAEASTDWLWETDADFRFTFATGIANGQVDGPPSDVIGRTRWEVLGVDIENDTHWRQHLENLLAHEPFRNFRYSRVGPHGQTLYRNTSGVPYYDPKTNGFLGYRGTTTDVTDQVEAEQRYRNLIEQAPTPMLVHHDETIAYANPAAVEMFGAASADELTGKSIIDQVHPDDRADFVERLSKIMRDGEASALTEQRRVRNDGSEIVVMTRGVPVMWDGRRAVLGSLIDITERVQAERQYRQLIENAPIALSVDDGERFILANQAFAEMFGGGSPEEIVGREISDMAHPADLEEFRDRVQAVARYRRTLPLSEIRRQRFDGGSITVLSRGIPIHWEGRPATLGIQMDVSERIATQQALQNSEERFRNLVEGSRQGVLIHVDSEPTFVNAALAEMFGYDSEEEVLALPSVLDLVAPEARENWRENQAARLNGLDVEDTYEFAGLHKDGTRISIHMTVRIVSWENRTAIQGTMLDVTRRREAEAQIRESEERFRLLTSTSPVGIFVTDAEGNCEYINESYETMSGLSTSQAMGQGWAQAIHPEDRDRVFEEWYSGIAMDKPFRTEYRFLRPDGSITWAIAQAVAQRDRSGRTLKFIGAVTDVSGRVRAELARNKSDDRFKTLTTLSPVGVFLTDDEGRVEYVNQSLATMLDMRPEEAFGINWINGIHPEDRESLLGAWEHAYNARENLEIELRMGDGSDNIRWVLVQASPLRSTESAVGYVGAVTDITERRVAEEQLRQVQKMDAIGQLTGGIAHDFNNLLAIVQGNLELLRERAPDDERLTSLINAAHGAARRGATLNQRLLAFARRQPLRPSLCDINQVVGDMAGLFVRTLGDNIELRTHFAEGLWSANVDPNGLETAVLNLAINARDAMPEGGTLTITSANRSYGHHRPAPDADIADGDYVLLRVSDSGTGMDVETVEKAFDPFYTTKGMGKGSGLGLSMVYGFARQSGGGAIVESALGEGTSITLLFPRNEGILEHHERVTAEPTPAGAGERILIVEDDLDVRDMAIGMFESLNYTTFIASSAVEALDILEKEDDIELLFTDVMLGTGDNGPELARKARQNRPGLRVLFASGYTMAEFEGGKSIELGALINKPYERAELARAVRVALETGRA